MEKGSKVQLTIDAIAAGGDGVGRIDGLAVFVPSTCRGDLIEAEITRVKSGLAYGKISKLIQPSPCRRADFCAQETFCGGCDFGYNSAR